MKINVLGSTGQLGGKVVQSLIGLGAAPGDIIASVRTPAKAEGLAAQGLDIRQADYDDPESLKAAFQGTDTLLLIPSFAPVEQRIQQFYQALEAAKSAGVKRVVFSSFATSVPDSRFYVTPFFLYAESKLRLSGLDWTILRNGMYLDPIADWVPELVEMGRLPYPVKEGRVAYISRDDLARATAAACLDSRHAGQLYELSGAEALTMSKLAEIISSVTGRPVRFDSIGEEEYARICREGVEGVPEPLIALLISLYHAVDNREFEKVTGHVAEITGRPPETAESYLRRVVHV